MNRNRKRVKKRRKNKRKARKPVRYNKNGIPIEGERPPRKRNFPGGKKED